MLRNISKALNTSNFYYDSKNFKDVTISNQQVAKHIKHTLSRINPLKHLFVFGDPRDYTGGENHLAEMFKR